MKLIALFVFAMGTALAVESPVKLEFAAPGVGELIDRGKGVIIRVKSPKPLKNVRMWWCNGDENDLTTAKEVMSDGKVYSKLHDDCHPVVGGPEQFEGDTSVSPDVSGWDWLGDGPYPIFAFAVDTNGKLVAISDLHQLNFKSKKH